LGYILIVSALSFLVSGMAQWLGCQSLAGRLSLICGDK